MISSKEIHLEEIEREVGNRTIRRTEWWVDIPRRQYQWLENQKHKHRKEAWTKMHRNKL